MTVDAKRKGHIDSGISEKIVKQLKMVFHLHHIIDTPNVNDTGPFSSKKIPKAG